MFAYSLLNLLAKRRKLMEISIFLLFAFLKEMMNYAKKEKKCLPVFYLSFIYK